MHTLQFTSSTKHAKTETMKNFLNLELKFINLRSKWYPYESVTRLIVSINKCNTTLEMVKKIERMYDNMHAGKLATTANMIFARGISSHYGLCIVGKSHSFHSFICLMNWKPSWVKLKSLKTQNLQCNATNRDRTYMEYVVIGHSSTDRLI